MAKVTGSHFPPFLMFIVNWSPWPVLELTWPRISWGAGGVNNVAGEYIILTGILMTFILYLLNDAVSWQTPDPLNSPYIVLIGYISLYIDWPLRVFWSEIGFLKWILNKLEPFCLLFYFQLVLLKQAGPPITWKPLIFAHLGLFTFQNHLFLPLINFQLVMFPPSIFHSPLHRLAFCKWTENCISAANDV